MRASTVGRAEAAANSAAISRKVAAAAAAVTLADDDDEDMVVMDFGTTRMRIMSDVACSSAVERLVAEQLLAGPLYTQRADHHGRGACVCMVYVCV